jgi:hypothetical protein
MVALVAEPEKYDGKVVRTIGLASIHFEGDALYLHEEDYRYGNLKNAVALRLTEAQRKQFSSLDLKHVIVQGTMYANGDESWDLAGAIGDITRFDYWGLRSDIPIPPDEPPSHRSRHP